MEIDSRVKYYLGNEFYDKKDIKNLVTIKDLETKKDKYKNLSHDNGIKDFKDLLERSNNIEKKFKHFFHDNAEFNVDTITLVKNRGYNNNKGVILRNIKCDRHWKNYYKKQQDIKFEDKEEKIFWRGTTTGSEKYPGNRFKLIKEWYNKNEEIDIGFSFICQNKNEYSSYVKGSCEIKDFLKYKYILSIPGNDKDSGLNWKLNSNSLVLMVKPRITSWLMETTLKENYHYILLKDDYSDLKEKLEWCKKNQEKCKEIIKNANKFMKQFENEKEEIKLEIEVINEYFKNIKEESEKL